MTHKARFPICHKLGSRRWFNSRDSALWVIAAFAVGWCSLFGSALGQSQTQPLDLPSIVKVAAAPPPEGEELPTPATDPPRAVETPPAEPNMMPHLAAPEPIPTPVVHRTTDYEIRLSQLHQQVDRNDQQLTARTDQVRQQLEKLKELLKQSSICQPKQSDPNAEPVHAHESVDAAGTTHDSTRSAAATKHPPGSSASDDTHTVSVTAPHENHAPVSPSLLDAIAVTDGPVDLFSLANNLYATGEISLALQIYQRLLATNLRDTDRVWVTYQIANCHRHLGNGSEAERAYRQIAGEKSVPSWSATARWWLDANNRTRQLQDMSQRLRTAIQELEGTKNANTNQ